jgi:hypothetical protein
VQTARPPLGTLGSDPADSPLRCPYDRSMRPWSILVVLVLGCAGAGPANPNVPHAGTESQQRPGFLGESSTSTAMVGTSDGTSCEEAREHYVEEIDMQRGGGPDLTANDLGSVLNAGAYLSPCDVPATSQVRICVAVKDGVAVGVTVGLTPTNPEIELCVAKQVRALSFPSNPKMDFVQVRF